MTCFSTHSLYNTARRRFTVLFAVISRCRLETMHYACDTEGDNQHDEGDIALAVEELRGVARKLSSADSASLPKLCQSARQRLLELVDQISESLIPDESGSDGLESNEEWHSQTVPRPVDAPAFNGCVRQSIQANGRRARQEVVDFIQASGRMLPAIAKFPSIEFQPSVLTLTVFCGPRFFNALSLACPSTSHDKQTACFQQETNSVEECPLNDVSGSTDGLELLFHAMEGEAPALITMQQAVGLINSAKYCMADALIPLLPCYFSPIMKDLQPREAAWFLCALAHSLSDRPEMLPTFVAFSQSFAAAPTLADSTAFCTFTAASTDPLATYSFAHLCHDVPFLLHASLEASLPPHMRAFLLAAACAAACFAGHTASSNTALAAQALDEVLLATCGHACTRCSHAVTFIVDLCTAPPAAGSEFSRQLLHHAHGRLLRGHFLAMAPQQLRMQREGVPVRFPTAVRSREMFAAQLTLPAVDGSCEAATLPTDTGWFLKIHAHEEPASGAGAATFSIFLNNEHAAAQHAISASFIVGVLADSPAATQAAEVFAASSEPLCDSRTSKLAPDLGIVHRSGCQLEFTGKGWGKFGFVSYKSLGKLGYTLEDGCRGPRVIVFACVQIPRHG
eukprot:jgi/Ulvmu1/5059/UM021_0076.1